MSARNSSFRQVTLKIPESKCPFFMELAKSLQFVKEIEANDMPAKKQALKNVKTGMKEVRLYKKGKLKTPPAKDFLKNL